MRQSLPIVYGAFNKISRISRISRNPVSGEIMLGAITGDIIGSVYEWDNIKTTGFELFSPTCFFTDDSVLTIALADSF
jgi:ADP-ribosylglycohydrolase